MLKCLLLNARSIVNKLPDLHYLLYEESYDVIFLTETWLKPVMPDGFIDPRHLYSIIRRDRCSGGGGLCALIRKPLSVMELELRDKYPNAEICGFDLKAIGRIIRFFNVYRPPGADNMSDIVACIEHFTLTSNPCIVVGDFNCRSINWDALTAPLDGVHDILLNFTVMQGFVQLVHDATRYNSLLDLVITNEPLIISDLIVAEPFCNSDHNTVAFKVFSDNLSEAGDATSTSAPNTYLDWDKADYNGIASYLSSINWYDLLAVNLTSDALWSAFHSVISDAINIFVPTKPYSQNKPGNAIKKRYPPGIRRALARKRCIWRQLKAHPLSSCLSNAYKNAETKCRQQIYNLELKREKKVINSNNAGSFYKFVNSKLACKKGVGALKSSCGKTVTEDKARADLLNDYFSSIGTLDNGVLPYVARQVPSDALIDNITFEPYKLERIMKKLKSTKSSGPDGLPICLFKKLAACFAEPLSILFTSLMSVGNVPKGWLHAIVTPIYKGGCASDLSNYRPISLTSVVSKIMERVIVRDLLSYLRKHNAISKQQHGFLSKRSTSSNLLNTINDWTLAIRDRKFVTVAYIDFQKAFDSVSHNKLLHKLSAFGICGNLLKWIKNFLTNRTQQTKIGAEMSSTAPIISGVVQGSVLGPLLFLLFINDVSSLLSDDKCFCQLYADDLKIYSILQYDDCGSALQHKLDVLCRWSDQWQLRIAEKKCVCMSVGRNNSNVQLRLNNNNINVTDCAKDLGVHVDRYIKFDTHISHIVAQAYIRVNLIFKCFVSRDILTLVNAFKVYVRPLLEYASCVWSPTYTTLKKQIEDVQKRFTKRLPGINNLSYHERMEKLSLESLEARRLKQDLTTTYKILFGYTNSVNELFTFSSHDHNTRGHPYKLACQNCRTNTRQHFFAERVVNIWNSLPVESCQFESLSKFKRCINCLNLNEHLLYT